MNRVDDARDICVRAPLMVYPHCARRYPHSSALPTPTPSSPTTTVPATPTPPRSAAPPTPRNLIPSLSSWWHVLDRDTATPVFAGDRIFREPSVNRGDK